MTNALGLTEFQKHVYDFVKDAIENGKYEVGLNIDYSSLVSGYIGGYIVIGGTKFNCSFNKGDYVCFHVDSTIHPVFDLITQNEEKKIARAAFALAKTDNAKNKRLIEEYKKRLESLEAVDNYETKENDK